MMHGSVTVFLSVSTGDPLASLQFNCRTAMLSQGSLSFACHAVSRPSISDRLGGDDLSDISMANLIRHPKSGSDWMHNELKA
jgi:hypothetical protein